MGLRRLILSTSSFQEDVEDSVDHSTNSLLKKARSTMKIPLDSQKLKGKWSFICIDFDRIMPNEA